MELLQIDVKTAFLTHRFRSPVVCQTGIRSSKVLTALPLDVLKYEPRWSSDSQSDAQTETATETITEFQSNTATTTATTPVTAASATAVDDSEAPEKFTGSADETETFEQTETETETALGISPFPLPHLPPLSPRLPHFSSVFSPLLPSSLLIPYIFSLLLSPTHVLSQEQLWQQNQ